MLKLNVCACLGNHSYWNKAHDIPDPGATPQKCSLNASEKAPQIASSHQASVSAPEARLIYISPGSGPWSKYMFFLSLRLYKFPSPT